VQLGHRVAPEGMVERQKGHSLLSVSAAVGFLILLYALMIRNMTKATMRKLIMVFRNDPYLITPLSRYTA
jgi:hypothetical protein